MSPRTPASCTCARIGSSSSAPGSRCRCTSPERRGSAGSTRSPAYPPTRDRTAHPSRSRGAWPPISGPTGRSGWGGERRTERSARRLRLRSQRHRRGGTVAARWRHRNRPAEGGSPAPPWLTTPEREVIVYHGGTHLRVPLRSAVLGRPRRGAPELHLPPGGQPGASRGLHGGTSPTGCWRICRPVAG